MSVGKTATESIREFRLVVMDPLETILLKDATKGKVVLDPVTQRTIIMFHNQLADGRIAERDELVILGTYLFKVLFNGNILKAFEKMLQERGEEQLLRVVLEFKLEARELAQMPWEYIYYPKDEYGGGFFIASKSNLILARYIPIGEAEIVWKPIRKPLHILLIVSQPKDLGPVQWEEIVETMDDLKKKLPATIETQLLHQPTQEEFEKQLVEFKPHILHFMGHGEYENNKGYLMFIKAGDAEQHSQRITDAKFANFFEKFQPRLVFLHACEGAKTESYQAFRGVALQLVYSSNVPAVVAMQYKIENKVAIKFAQKFYQCVGESKRIDVAVQEGRWELGMYLDQEESFNSRAFGSPVVYIQSAEAILIDKAVGEEKPFTTRSVKATRLECPNRDCTAYVLKSDKICARCRDLLGECPNCLDLMSLTKGICVHCTFDIKRHGGGGTRIDFEGK